MKILKKILMILLIIFSVLFIVLLIHGCSVYNSSLNIDINLVLNKQFYSTDGLHKLLINNDYCNYNNQLFTYKYNNGILNLPAKDLQFHVLDTSKIYFINERIYFYEVII